ncbi:hypothetical protein FLM9_1491 [Candidatus Synechococcus spongiarum]|uniref:Uncharacterized protein n=1 Tax=Candidatus Synechococcus spongiarum TaxID=431041 RepID=A0A161KAH6_9SYNE|nr:hypothetical protein FLM9_1491 [Candidatus Synechococcus spongiarum]
MKRWDFTWQSADTEKPLSFCYASLFCSLVVYQGIPCDVIGFFMGNYNSLMVGITTTY